ncbi:TadE/TadG family type IV pilus assembly protein [Ruegeria atlantica]|uniref:TadE/TadG family type IV pilus assembly protein n=1 Tax=Ruegeria atlantica TaxID=81569 RepID=UPI00147F0FDB|nr:pilus assembly protein [Ruegeria atlantica]
MTRLTLRIRHLLGTFAGKENGNLSLESALIFPMLVWSVTLTYTYFDAFRENTANLKAAYTISDLISREGEGDDPLTDTYAQSMYLMYNRMVTANSPLKMRLSVIQYFAADDNAGTEERYLVEWSTACGYESNWTNDNLEPLIEKLPPLADTDSLIIVETSKPYVPILDTNWLDRDHTFENFVFTRPRFVPIVKGPASTHFCQQDAAVGVAPGA